MSDRTWTDALSGISRGAKPSVEVDGVTYTFTLHVPAWLAAMGRMARQWGQAKLAEMLEALPERNVPGTMDYDMAAELKRDHLSKVGSGYYNAPALGGAKKGGEGYIEWSQTPEGQMGVIRAALAVDRPDITHAEVLAVAAAKPDEVVAIMDSIKNTLRGAAAGGPRPTTPRATKPKRA